MTRHRLGPHTPALCEIRVEGHLDERWSAWLGGLTLHHHGDGTTTLRGVMADQAEVFGAIAKVRDTGATLIAVALTEAPGPPGSR
ncbi:MAG: hypothetical protein U0R23_00790 [Candidatus Nanopelagicales bacterium]